MADAINNSLSPTLDTNSPYYIDQDFLQFHFSIEKLSEAKDNYVIWKLRVLAFLSAMNKVGFIDGTLPKPDTSSPLYPAWNRCNAMVMRCLRNLMSDELLEYVAYAETAHKAWEDLRRRFVPSIDLKIYQLRRRLATLRQGGDSVEKYYGKLSKAWMELSEYDPVQECKCGGCNCEIAKRAEEAREKEQRYAFLMGLNKELDVVRMQIMYTNTSPSLHEAYVMVKQAESSMKWNKR